MVGSSLLPFFCSISFSGWNGKSSTLDCLVYKLVLKVNYSFSWKRVMEGVKDDIYRLQNGLQ